MKIYEWNYTTRTGDFVTIQVVANTVNSARKKAVKFIESQKRVNKHLLKNVKEIEPHTFDIQMISESPYESAYIETY